MGKVFHVYQLQVSTTSYRCHLINCYPVMMQPMQDCSEYPIEKEASTMKYRLMLACLKKETGLVCKTMETLKFNQICSYYQNSFDLVFFNPSSLDKSSKVYGTLHISHNSLCSLFQLARTRPSGIMSI